MADWTSRGKIVRPSACTFGRRLRDQREQRGVTLEEIAATTKINVSLLAALERGDVSAWPSGIFRRAFIRGYAAAIGAAPEPIIEEFGGPPPDHEAAAGAIAPQQAADECRMTLALDPGFVLTTVVIRVVIALVEVCLIVAASVAAAAWTQRFDAWQICAAVALVYYPLTKILPLGGDLVGFLSNTLQSRGKDFQQVAATEPCEAPTGHAAVT